MSHDPNSNYSGFDWMQADRIDVFWWAAAFIWGGLVLLFANTGWPGSSNWWDSWGVFFTGICVFALVCAVARLQMQKYRSKWLFSLVFGVMFLAIGLGAWDAAWWFWVLVLLTIGAVMLRSALRRET